MDNTSSINYDMLDFEKKLILVDKHVSYIHDSCYDIKEKNDSGNFTYVNNSWNTWNTSYGSSRDDSGGSKDDNKLYSMILFLIGLCVSVFCFVYMIVKDNYVQLLDIFTILDPIINKIQLDKKYENLNRQYSLFKTSILDYYYPLLLNKIAICGGIFCMLLGLSNHIFFVFGLLLTTIAGSYYIYIIYRKRGFNVLDNYENLCNMIKIKQD